LRHLARVCDIAETRGLQLEPTFFTGHMSGPNWAPSWLVDRGRRARGERQLVGLTDLDGAAGSTYDIYETPFVIAAEDRLLATVCRGLAGHPAIWAWSLGNEPDLFCRPRSAAAGRAWVRGRVATIRREDPGRPVLVGLHEASLRADVGLRLDDIAAETDVSVMHGYPIYSPLARDPLDPDYVPFTAALSAALAGRPILYEEFGINTRSPDGVSHWEELGLWDGGRRATYFASEDDAAHYYAAVLPRLVRVGAIGAFVWCFADYDPRLWHLPPCDYQVHERFFGLVRADGTLKPSAAAVRSFAASAPVVRAADRQVELPSGASGYYSDPPRLMAEAYERFGRLD